MLDLAFNNQPFVPDPRSDSVVFAGHDGHRSINCRIAREAIRNRFGHCGPVDLDAARAAADHRAQIETVARRKFLARRIELDGSIVLHSEDF